jgi:hypothetical protein
MYILIAANQCILCYVPTYMQPWCDTSIMIIFVVLEFHLSSILMWCGNDKKVLVVFGEQISKLKKVSVNQKYVSYWVYRAPMNGYELLLRFANNAKFHMYWIRIYLDLHTGFRHMIIRVDTDELMEQRYWLIDWLYTNTTSLIYVWLIHEIPTSKWKWFNMVMLIVELISLTKLQIQQNKSELNCSTKTFM